MFIKIEQQSLMMRHYCYNKTALRAIFRRSFMSGAGSVLSLSGRTVSLPRYERRTAGPSLDAEAIRGDWNRVGEQLVWASRLADK